MIDAQELMLGNWVKAQDGLKQISWVGIGRIGWAKQDGSGHELAVPENIDPIPLSPEVLEKCGFVPHTEGKGLLAFEGYRKKNMFLCFRTGNGWEVDFAADWDTWEERNTIREIQHLHQLQNLLFALTGQQLNVQW